MDKKIPLPNRITTSEILYMGSLVIYLSVMVLRTTFFAAYIPEPAYKLICLGCWILLFLGELLKEGYSLKLFIILGVTLFFMLVAHRVTSLVTSTPILFIYCGRTYDFRRIARVTAWLTVFWLGLVILFSKVGLLENYVMDAKYERPREFLGFRYALYGSSYLLNIVTIDFYLNREKIPWWRTAFYAIFGYWLYYRTDSRLCGLFTFTMVAAIVYLKLHSHVLVRPKPTLYRFLTVFLTAAWVFGMAVSLLFVKVYSPENPLMEKLNTVLTGRLEYAQESVETYGISLFGKHIEWIGNGLTETGETMKGEYLYVDNLYVQFLQRYGILFTLIFLAMLTLLMFRARRMRDTHLLFVLCMLAAHAMVDDLILHIWFNPFWILLAHTAAELTWRREKGKMKVNVPALEGSVLQ